MSIGIISQDLIKSRSAFYPLFQGNQSISEIHEIRSGMIKVTSIAKEFNIFQMTIAKKVMYLNSKITLNAGEFSKKK